MRVIALFVLMVALVVGCKRAEPVRAPAPEVAPCCKDQKKCCDKTENNCSCPYCGCRSGRACKCDAPRCEENGCNCRVAKKVVAKCPCPRGGCECKLGDKCDCDEPYGK